MKPYRIYFQGNTPASAIEADSLHKSNVEIEYDQSNKQILWIAISADDEQDALNAADEIYQSIIGYL